MAWTRAEPGVRRAARRWRQLVLLCALVNVAESAVVMLADPGTRPQLAAQASAVAPWGLFSDLRWVVVFNSSWAQGAALLAGVLLARGLLNALMTALAWPERVPRPRAARLVARSLYGTVIMAALLAAPVTVMFGAAAIPVSWLFFAGVPTVLVLALVAHPIGVSGDWWRRPFSWRGSGWMGFSFLVLSLCGLATSALPTAFGPVIAALAGAFNAWAWTGTVHATIDRPSPRHVVPAVPAGVITLAAVVAVFTTVGFADARPKPVRDVHTTVEGRAATVRAVTGPPVLIVSGYGSTWDGNTQHPVPGPFSEVRFSYRGLSRTGAPLPYNSAATVKPISELDRMFISQLTALARRSGQKVAVVAESEGALMAKTALLATPGAPVSDLILVSPLQAPARVGYPVNGEQGWGVASAGAMQLLTSAIGTASPIDLSPDNAFLESMEADAPGISSAMACALPHVHQVAVLPLADATVSPSSPSLDYPSMVVAAFHGGVTASPEGGKVVADLLTDRRPHDDSLLAFAEQTISGASQAWQVPPLPLHDFPGVTQTTTRLACGNISAHLRLQMQEPTRSR